MLGRDNTETWRAIKGDALQQCKQACNCSPKSEFAKDLTDRCFFPLKILAPIGLSLYESNQL